MKKIVVLLTVLVAGVSYAQQSASYSMRQSVFNQGGAPVAGATPESASYALSQLSIGESIAPSRLTGGAYVLDTGFGAFWLPPGEVMNLRFSDPETLLWDPQSVAYRYNLYRGAPTSFLC